jgi:response regulator of citrate/malate metabolism
MEKLPQILIIDDDPLTGYLHKTFIKKVGVSHQIKTLTSGEQAIQYLKECVESKNEENIPQLILLEVDMPMADGFHFLEAYQNLEFKNKDSVAVAVLTCSISKRQKNRTKEYPIKDYILKPLTEERMMGLMERCFSGDKNKRIKS